MTYVSSASEDPPEEREDCRCCGDVLCADCGSCPSRALLCRALACICSRISLRRAQGIPDERWQEALDDAADGAIDDAKVAEVES